MREIIIKKNDSNQRLDKFLSKRFKTMPKSLMYKYIRTKYIKLNKKKCTPETFLNEGDVLTLYISDEFFETKKTYEFMKASSDLSIVYEDENILLIDKKPGVICHQDKKYDSDTLNLRVLRYLYEKKEYNPDDENSFTPSLCNRIDRNTGGIVIAAKNAEALRVINSKIKSREIKKIYQCIVLGKPKKESAILKDYLIKDEKTNKVKVLKKESKDAKEIITKYKVLSSENNLSLCEVELLTGRTHQIRAHMASISCPLLGDNKYGNKKINDKFHMNKQALYSYKLRFEFSDNNTILDYLNNKEFTVKKVWFSNNKKIALPK